MKKQIIAVLLSTTFTSLSFAGQFTDFATVKSVEPQYNNVNQPVQRCHEETVQQTTPGYQEKSYGGAILGGVAGGLLGHTVGGGNGRSAATAVGAVVGALTGESIQNSNAQYAPPQTTTTNVQRCQMEDNMVQIVSTYKVTYEYKGKIESFNSQTAPSSDKIKVNINITPIVESYQGYAVPNSQPIATPYIR